MRELEERWKRCATKCERERGIRNRRVGERWSRYYEIVNFRQLQYSYIWYVCAGGILYNKYVWFVAKLIFALELFNSFVFCFFHFFRINIEYMIRLKNFSYDLQETKQIHLSSILFFSIFDFWFFRFCFSFFFVLFSWKLK